MYLAWLSGSILVNAGPPEPPDAVQIVIVANRIQVVQTAIR